MSPETKIGNYILGEPIGHGGMGVVYRGRHATLPRAVAVKSIETRGTGDLRHLRRRFEREAYIQSQLDHPGIVKIYDYVVAGQTYYIVMEYVEGRSLAQLLADASRPLDINRALDLFEQILAAVAYAHGFVYRDEEGEAHRGIIHCDLKPHNILVAPGDHIKVADFGIVKLVGATEGETSGRVYGSPAYVSPEQARDVHVDQRSDIYALGVMLYQMLTGSVPFGANPPLTRTEILRAHVYTAPRPPSELNPQITPELERVVCRALEKKPERRYAGALEFLRALRHARGRDTADLDAAATQHTSFPPATNRADEAAHAATEGARRESYLTQPIQGHTCKACGTEAAPGDRRCRACGQELNASPATAQILQRERTTHGRTRRLQTILPLVALALLGAGVVIYFARDKDAPPRSQSASDAPSQPPLQSSPAAANVADPAASSASQGALVQLQPARVEVDSTFDGYDVKPLTDGVVDVRRIASMQYNRGNWASAETPVPHWIELEFERPARISAVYVFWGFDRTRFTPSRRIELQTPDAAGGWRTISTLAPGDDFDRTAFEFEPLETTRLRIFQPAQQGPVKRPFVMWVREVQIFGAGGASS